ncbi:zinc-dependent peptidase [Alkalilimnicola sp. S0819]|uniref:M90 family metallopeptidase n=1 Tax=Alkalilimnicola sp. S0819 TaxID=2613922 RepID=UPI001261EB77|nr:M90 family metallopeptidase [Alkalilimnicola sp. S0819]KAB7619658.1 zinc-dependent peptidase [Alkalilimnicola sp. S0819]MPQ17597.1 hypothetical protein [Alkalilimnicola sp. S0819]
MTAVWLVLALLPLGLLFGGLLGCWRRWRHRRIAAAPFPPDWERVLMARWLMYRRLPEALRQRLRERLRLFLAEKNFIPCAGLEMSEEMPLLIAAQACLLVAHRPLPPYPALHSILLYPAAYLADTEHWDEAGVVSSGQEARLGESWEGGQVVLGWEQVAADLAEPDDAHNVVLHEFAHQLDHDDGLADGLPVLPESGMYRRWGALFSEAWEDLQRQLQAGEPTLLDPYAATDPAEFFAVLVETFFEQPHPLAAENPPLYTLLTEYFALDPREWQPLLDAHR